MLEFFFVERLQSNSLFGWTEYPLLERRQWTDYFA